jgi:hypothetical protein
VPAVGVAVATSCSRVPKATFLKVKTFCEVPAAGAVTARPDEPCSVSVGDPSPTIGFASAS